jgi:hypothetical protein
VHTTTPYEQSIAAKLGQVPVPDMADSIWASIDGQLGEVVDAPVKKTPPKYTGKIWYGFVGVVVVVTSLWWYYSRKDHKPIPPIPQKTIPAVQDSLPPKDSTPVIRDEQPPAAPLDKKKYPTIVPDIPKDSPVIDTAAAATVTLPPVKLDSVAKQNIRPQEPDVNTLPGKPPGKQPKGVKGIGPDDYRISAGKDSTKKGN